MQLQNTLVQKTHIFELFFLIVLKTKKDDTYDYVWTVKNFQTEVYSFGSEFTSAVFAHGSAYWRFRVKRTREENIKYLGVLIDCLPGFKFTTNSSSPTESNWAISGKITLTLNVYGSKKAVFSNISFFLFCLCFLNKLFLATRATWTKPDERRGSNGKGVLQMVDYYELWTSYNSVLDTLHIGVKFEDLSPLEAVTLKK